MKIAGFGDAGWILKCLQAMIVIIQGSISVLWRVRASAMAVRASKKRNYLKTATTVKRRMLENPGVEPLDFDPRGLYQLGIASNKLILDDHQLCDSTMSAALQLLRLLRKNQSIRLSDVKPVTATYPI